MKKYFFSILLILALSSCPQGNYFTEFKDVNLVAGYPLNPANWTVNTTTTYLNFESITPAAAGDVTGLPITTAISRLEIPNLFGNGDFEAALSPDWSAVNNPSVPDADYYSIDSLNPKAITGNSLYYAILDSADRIVYNLSGLEKGTYRINFDFKRESADTVTFAIFENSSEIVTWEKFKPEIPSATVINFQEIMNSNIFGLISDTPLAQFSINSSLQPKQKTQSQSAIDNIRIMRLDQEPQLALNLSFAAADRLTFVSGTYRFSLYVRSENAANLTPNVPNRFSGDGIKLSLYNIRDTFDAESGIHTYTVVNQPGECTFSTAELDFTSWVQIAVDGMIQIAESETNDAIVMRLGITPAYSNAGSMLIACPSLELITE